MIFLYLPGIGLIHFLSAAAMGIMAMLSGNAIRDMSAPPSDQDRR